MTNQARFTIASLLEGKSALVQITPVAADGSLPASAGAGLQRSKGLGLEIENIAALPDAEDYSLHEFYRANFAPSEIAYCIRQHAVKAAFQGLLAAKHAIVKSGAASDSPDGPRSVEIGFDGEGRVVGELVPTGIRPHFHERFEIAGIDLPISMFAKV